MEQIVLTLCEMAEEIVIIYVFIQMKVGCGLRDASKWFD